MKFSVFSKHTNEFHGCMHGWEASEWCLQKQACSIHSGWPSLPLLPRTSPWLRQNPRCTGTQLLGPLGSQPEGIVHFPTIVAPFLHTHLSPSQHTFIQSQPHISQPRFFLPNEHFPLSGRLSVLPSLLLISNPHSLPSFLHFFSG